MSILGTILGAGTSLFNTMSQANTNAKNLDYAKATTEQQWERDDTTYQRSVEDAVKAGFSPLAVLDGGLVGNSSAMAYQGQAPQFDVNSMMSALLQKENQEFMAKEADKRHTEQMELQKQEFKNNIEILNTQFEQSKDLENLKLSNELDYLVESTNANMYSQRYKNSLDALRESGIIELKEYTNEEDYKVAHNGWIIDFNSFIDGLLETSTSKGAEGHVTGKVGGEASAGASAGPFAHADTKVYGEVEAGVSGSSQTNTTNTIQIAQRIKRFMLEHPYPVMKTPEYKRSRL